MNVCVRGRIGKRVSNLSLFHTSHPTPPVFGWALDMESQVHSGLIVK